MSLRTALFLSLLLIAPLEAQSTVTEQSLAWAGYFATVDLNRDWYTVGEFQERRWRDDGEVHQRLWRAHLHRRITPKVAIGGGCTYFLQGVQSPDLEPLPLVPEHRPHLQLDVRSPLTTRWSLTQRVRAEYRILSRTEGGRVVVGTQEAGRLRYRLNAEYRVNPGAANAVVLRGSNELHVMFGDRPLHTPFDQNRLQASIVLPMQRDLTVEMAYLWWWQKRRGQDAYFDRDIARVIVHHRVRRAP